MSEEGVSIKAKNRIKKMTKLRILEKGQKLAKIREPAMVRSRKAGHRPGGSSDSTGLRGGSHTSCLAATRVRSDNTQAPWLTERSGTEASWEERSIYRLLSSGEGRRRLLPRRDGGPTRTLRPASPVPRASSPLARVRVVPPVQPQRPGVHAVVNGAVLEVKGRTGA